MATFITTIQLHDADQADYEILFRKLGKQFLNDKCHIIKEREYADGKNEYKWKGNVSIQEIAHAIARSLAGMGKKYSFTIVRNKLVAG